MQKSWVEMGESMGLEVVEDERGGAGRGRQGGGEDIDEGEGDEEEVGNRYVVFDVRQVEQCTVQYMCK